MPLTLSKLEMFTEFALMDQQFALVVYANPALKKELKHILEHKKTKGDIEMVSREVKVTDKADLLFEQKSGLLFFELNAGNFDEVFEAVSQIRHKGVYDTGTFKFVFPDDLKLLFTVDKEFLNELPARKREKLLYIFSPVYSE